MTRAKNKPNGKSAHGGNRACRFRWLRHLGVSQEILKRADRARRPARVVITWEDGAEEAFAGEGARAIWLWALTGAWMGSAGQPTGREIPGLSPATRGVLAQCLRQFAAELELEYSKN